MTRAANRVCLAKHLEAEGRHDMAGTLDTLHPECLFEDQPVGLTLYGRDGAKRHYEMWWTAFGVTTEAGKLHWIDDDLAIGEAYFVGVHRGPFLGIAATGREIRFPFTVVVTFRDGLLAGERFTYDLNDILRQIGQPHFDTAAAKAA